MNTIVAKRIEFQTNRKSQCTDSNIPLFLFRDMDFYFMYNEDAETIGQILGASGKVAHAEDFTFAAFSASKLDQYLPLIIRKGYRVAIVDNLF
jgi:DNA mismatch repair ATPase MutS